MSWIPFELIVGFIPKTGNSLSVKEEMEIKKK